MKYKYTEIIGVFKSFMAAGSNKYSDRWVAEQLMVALATSMLDLPKHKQAQILSNFMTSVVSMSPEVEV